MDYYTALIHKEDLTDYGVMFPDFPGCVATGASIEEAIRQAQEALAFHVQGMKEDGGTIPAPRTVEEIKAAREAWIDFADAIVLLVGLLPEPEGRMQATNLSLDASLVRTVDRYAEKLKLSRSAVFAEGVKLLMRERPVSGVYDIEKIGNAATPVKAGARKGGNARTGMKTAPTKKA